MDDDLVGSTLCAHDATGPARTTAIFNGKRLALTILSTFLLYDTLLCIIMRLDDPKTSNRKQK